MSDNDGYVCTHCGAEVDIPADARVQVTIVSRADRAIEREVALDGRVVHRCPIAGPE